LLIQNFTVLIESAVKQIVIPKHQKEKEVNQINVVKTFTILPHLLKQNESRQRKWYRHFFKKKKKEGKKGKRYSF
jgi:hypothetical protein